MDESDFLFFVDCKDQAQKILSYEDAEADHHLVYAFFHSRINGSSSIEERINDLRRIGESSMTFGERLRSYRELKE
jgi:hypothetical protein